MKRLFLYLDKRNTQFSKWADGEVDKGRFYKVIIAIFLTLGLVAILPLLIIGDLKIAMNVSASLMIVIAVVMLAYAIWVWNDIFKRGN